MCAVLARRCRVHGKWLRLVRLCDNSRGRSSWYRCEVFYNTGLPITEEMCPVCMNDSRWAIFFVKVLSLFFQFFSHSYTRVAPPPEATKNTQLVIYASSECIVS
jgi:hypothetical protein